MFDEEWKKLGINVRHIDKINFIAKPGAEGMSQDEAMRKGLLSVDSSDVEWADLVMFRRYYNCSYKCDACGHATKDVNSLKVHPHEMKIRDTITEWMWPAFESKLFDKAIIYETDDNHFQIRQWNGYYPDVQAELPLIERMAKRADLVTVSTGPIKDAYSHLNDNIRVIKNAIDPSIYTTSSPLSTAGEGRPRVVYYGSTARMRDYGGFPSGVGGKWEGGYAGKAIEDLRKELWNVFIGVNPGTEHVVAPFFDEAFQYIENIKQFSEVLTRSNPDIGIAPLVGDSFDRCKSELHWLEYSMVGAAFVGQKFKYTFANLLTSLRLSLRDPNATTWSNSQLGELINRGIEAVGDVYQYETIQTTSFTQPILGTVFSTALTTVSWPIRVDVYDGDGKFRETVQPASGDGPASGWEAHGGVLYMPTHYHLGASSGTLNIVGYGSWAQIDTAQTSSATNLDTTAQNAVKVYVEAEALTMLTFDRAQYQQWQVSSGSSDISALGMNNLALAAQQRWRQEKNRIRRFRKGG